MARKPTRSSSTRAPFSASSTRPIPKSKPKSKRKLDPSNTYTYLLSLPKRHRTSEANLSLSREERDGLPSTSRLRDEDEEEDERMEARIAKVAMKIAEEGPGEVESGESDVVSDDAWEEDGSDEERWGEVFRGLQRGNGKAKAKVKAKDVMRKPTKPIIVDLNEDEADSSSKKRSQAVVTFAVPEGDGDGVVDEVLHEDEDEDKDEEEGDHEDEEDEADHSAEAEVLPTRIELAGSDENGDEDGNADEEGNADEDEDADDDEDDASDIELPSDLSDGDDEPDHLDGLDAFVDQLASADKKRKTTAEGTGDSGTKKRRVLPVVAGPGLTDSGALGLRSNHKLDLSTLIASHPSLAGASALLPSKTEKKSPSSILKQGVLPAPLPTVVQERIDREAAYEKTKEEGAKWGGVMKRVKEAEHLSFPLQASDRGGVKSNGEMLANFKPGNQLESAVDALLRQANLTDASMAQHEDLALEAQDLSNEEIAGRRAQLRQQRELMFRAETRAKRVAKIKSKTFRKLARKRQERAGGDVSLEQLERTDPEKAEEEREKMERLRATERATLRHGARNGRWARDVGGDGGELEDRRRAKEDMLEIKERLQRKIMGREEGDVESSEGDEGEDDDEEMIKGRAFDQLAGLDGKEPDEKEGGLMQMAFMKKAREREMRRVKEDEQGLRREIELFGEDVSESSADEEDEAAPQAMRVGGNEGRMVFSGPERVSDLQRAGDLYAAPKAQPPTPLPVRSRSPPPPPDHNPWLVPSANAGPSRKRNSVVTNSADKATRALKKQASKSKDLVEEDERVDIDVDGRATYGANGLEEESDEDELLPANGIKAFKQRDLVAEAFAGDNVVDDFAKEKQRQVAADAPTVEDTSLPGWGSWGGKGTRKRRADPRFLIKIAGIEPSHRKDFTRSNVIITEKKDKRASQFLVKDLPYPYTSVAQYERSFEMPLGSEWNSRAVHQRETLPRVVKKPGAIIEPIRRLF